MKNIKGFPDDGWKPWLFLPSWSDVPYDYVEVEIYRQGWDESSLQAPEANPEMNAVGLWWRPAGPKRSPAERLAQAMRAIA